MSRKNSDLTKAPPARSKAIGHLRTTGLAFEYFPAFRQPLHDFHTHDFVEILFVIGGRFRHVTEDKTYDESAGGLTIVNYNQFHTLRTSGPPVELMNVYWNLTTYPLPELPAPLSDRLRELIPIHPMLGHRLNRVLHLQLKHPEKVENLLRMLYQEQQNKAAGNEAAIDALFRLFLIELCRAAPADPGTITDGFNPRMEKVRNYLEEHFTEPVRLEQLCRLSELKKANLCRQFKNHTGLSTGDYLKQRRLAAALQKLRTTDDKILAVCHDCGFSDIANFNRIFRSTFRITPSDYRKNAAG